MNKNIFIIIIVILLIISIYFLYLNFNKENNGNKISKESSNFNNKIDIVINDKNYILKLEDNSTTRKLLKKLPLNFDMEELNGNEKYIYLDETFPTNKINPKHINKGDVMLYGNNCLVIFYKNFDTSYSYTKIGHIDNLEDLDNQNIKVKLLKQ